MESKVIDSEKIKTYWLESSKKDNTTMINLYNSKDFSWALFVGHLVIEKLLKALYVHKKHQQPMFTHDLLRIANKLKLNISKEQTDKLDFITTFNINARYDNYKQDFYKLCSQEFTDIWIKNIKDIKLWIENQF